VIVKSSVCSPCRIVLVFHGNTSSQPPTRHASLVCVANATPSIRRSTVTLPRSSTSIVTPTLPTPVSSSPSAGVSARISGTSENARSIPALARSLPTSNALTAIACVPSVTSAASHVIENAQGSQLAPFGAGVIVSAPTGTVRPSTALDSPLTLA
jgi:hypothetical protein